MRLYAICKTMKFTHLPQAGGLYDQHPKLLDGWMIIIAEEAKAEHRRSEKQKAEAKSKRTSGMSRRASSGGKRRR